MLQSMLYPATIYILTLFLPGYLWLRSVRLPAVYALCCAPVISSALVGLLGEVYARIGVPATPLSIYLPLVCLPAMALLALRARAGKGNEAPEPLIDLGESYSDVAWWLPLLFVFFGVLACNDLFASELPALDAVVQRYDVQHHLNCTQAMAEARRVSSLGVSSYLTEADKAIMPWGRGSFYPAVWYGQCALLMQAIGISAPVALNVALFVSIALAYPLGICALAASVFGKRQTAILFCAPVCVGFVTFPWCMFLFGPLYPNMVGFALLPASVTLCMHAFLAGPSKRNLAVAWLAALGSLLGLALLHPNTVFSAYLILIPFVAQLVYTKARERKLGTPASLGAVGVFLLACFAFWVLCYKAPFFKAVLSELWPYYAYPWQQIVNILTQVHTLFFYGEFAAQILLGALVVIGFVRQAYDRPISWLAASYLVVCFVCYINATSPNSTLKRFVAGFWYTDAVRVSAMVVIVAALLGGFGLDWVYTQTCEILDRYNARLQRKTHPYLVGLVLVACFYVINFMPGFNWPGAHADSSDFLTEYRIEGHEYDAYSVKTTFGDYKRLVRNAYKKKTPVDVHERAFLDQTKAIVGTDLVINNPSDGSTLAYGMIGLRTYFRKVDGTGSAFETEESVLIREGLCNLATDEAVRKAVERIGARYVLVLDAHYSGSSFLNLRNNLDKNAFRGISQITPDTPGFTEVLVSGSCHLYRIGEDS